MDLGPIDSILYIFAEDQALDTQLCAPNVTKDVSLCRIPSEDPAEALAVRPREWDQAL